VKTEHLKTREPKGF